MSKNSKKLLVSSLTAATLGLLANTNQNSVKAASLSNTRPGAVKKGKKVPKLNVLKLKAKALKGSSGAKTTQNSMGGGVLTLPIQQ